MAATTSTLRVTDEQVDQAADIIEDWMRSWLRGEMGSVGALVMPRWQTHTHDLRRRSGSL